MQFIKINKIDFSVLQFLRHSPILFGIVLWSMGFNSGIQETKVLAGDLDNLPEKTQKVIISEFDASSSRTTELESIATSHHSKPIQKLDLDEFKAYQNSDQSENISNFQEFSNISLSEEITHKLQKTIPDQFNQTLSIEEVIDKPQIRQSSLLIYPELDFNFFDFNTGNSFQVAFVPDNLPLSIPSSSVPELNTIYLSISEVDIVFNELVLEDIDSFFLSQETPENPTFQLPDPADLIPPSESTPEPEIPDLSPPDELFPVPDSSPSPTLPETNIPGDIFIEKFNIIGSTVFDSQDFAEITEPYLNRPLSLAELLEVRSLITQKYIDAGYITTGALIPRQDLGNNIITIEVIEGRIEAINVMGNRRLNPNYVQSRLALGAKTPLNVNDLREALQLLQLDPLIANLSSELSAGTTVGSNVLDVQITEAETFDLSLPLSNNRSPLVGSFRRGVSVTEANLLGIGDRINTNYQNTDGSNSFDINYTVPFNPQNGTIRISYGDTHSEVIEEPFEPLNITSNSTFIELGIRQPLLLTPTEEFAIGLTLSQQESQSEIGLFDIPLVSDGANDQGRSKVSALRFIQEWTKRSERQVFAVRSQFSWGLDWFEATDNAGPPESTFFAWRGQAQWVRLLGSDMLLVVRGDAQFSDRSLLSLEQFGLGGQESVRGYRQDQFFQDNGILTSAELRIPVVRVPEWEGVLQVAPFFDAGWGWSHNQNSEVAIAAVGLGLRWQQGNNFTVRLDWGIPLSDVDSSNNTLQESGLYFSISYSPF